MNEYAPQANKLPPDVADQVTKIGGVLAAVKKQLSPDGGRLSDSPLHLEKLEESSADDHNPRFTNADDFWKNGMDPSRANPSQDGSDTSEKLPSKFVNNFWQYFFPDEMFEDDLLGPTVLNKPPRKLLKEAGGELLKFLAVHCEPDPFDARPSSFSALRESPATDASQAKLRRAVLLKICTLCNLPCSAQTPTLCVLKFCAA